MIAPARRVALITGSGIWFGESASQTRSGRNGRPDRVEL